MRSNLDLPRSLLAITIGLAMVGCSASLVAPDAGKDPPPTPTPDPIDAGSASDGAVLLAPTAIMYPSLYRTGASGLTISNGPLGCADRDVKSICSIPNVYYWVGLELPAEDVVPGSYPLSSLTYPYYAVTAPNIDEPTCWGGSGGFTAGTLTIVSVSNTAVVLRFQDTDTSDFDINGITFVAQVCPGA